MVKIQGTNKVHELDVEIDMALAEDTINADMCELPMKIAHYASVLADLQALSANRKNYLETLESLTAQDIRKDAESKGKKITENAIKEQIAADKDVAAARKEYYKTSAEYTLVDGYYRALRDKVNLAIAICYKLKEEIKNMSI